MHSLKKLYYYMGRYRKDFYIAIMLIAIETSLELVIPKMMADLIDIGAMNKDLPYMLEKGGQMALCALLALITGLSYARYGARAAYGWGANLRNKEFENIATFSFSNIDRFEKESLITRMTQDVNVVQGAVTGGLRPLVRSPIMLILGIIFSFSMNPRLSIIFIVLTPVLAILLFLIVRSIGPRYRRQQKAIDNLSLVIEENVRGIRTVKAFVREAHEKAKFDTSSSNLRDAAIDTQSHAQLNMPTFQAAMYTTILLLMFFGGRMIGRGELSVGELTGFLSYVMQILNSMMMLSNVFLLLTRSLASADRICEVLEEESDMENGIEKEMQRGKEVVKVEKMSFSYTGGEYALKDIDFSIREGETIGIVGMTGSGKSSLIQLLSRLYDASSGRILFEGRDVREYDEEVLRRNIATILQKNTLFTGSIRENLAWGDAFATEEEMLEALGIAGARDFVLSFPSGLDTMIGQEGAGLSGGQRQRISIARALLKKPRLIIFDDSLSAVDTRTEKNILDNLKKLDGLTKIFIATRLSTLRSANRILVLDSGRLECMGSHEELMEKSRLYRKIYEIQMKEGGEVDG